MMYSVYSGLENPIDDLLAFVTLSLCLLAVALVTLKQQQ